MTSKLNRRRDGIKTDYLRLPLPVTPSRFKCIQMTIPDHEAWEQQLRTAFHRYLGFWTNFGWNDKKQGIRVARVWQWVESTITDCGTSGDTTPDDECCEPSQDIFDEFDADNIEDLYEKMTAALTPFVGQVTMGIVQPTSGAWLKCDGSFVNKVDYPQLYDLLVGITGETETTFAVPDFRDRVPMGANATVGLLDVDGSDEKLIETANLPAHDHSTPNHTHTSPIHSHSTSNHFHTIPEHDHETTIPNHTHAIPTREPGSAFGTGVVAQQSQALSNSTRTTGSDGGGTFGTTSQSGGTSTDSASAGDTNGTIVIINSGGGSVTGETGGGSPLDILNPVIGIHFFIFAGFTAAAGVC